MVNARQTIGRQQRPSLFIAFQNSGTDSDFEGEGIIQRDSGTYNVQKIATAKLRDVLVGGRPYGWNFTLCYHLLREQLLLHINGVALRVVHEVHQTVSVVQLDLKYP
jgi:hypothetical protein